MQTFLQAVFSSTKEVSITVPDESPNSGDGSVVHNRGIKHVLVPAITLDSFCTAGIRPNILKIDGAGAKYEVLVGAREIIAQFRPELLIELQHFSGDFSAHPVPDLLAGWGYRARWIDHWQLTSHILATPAATASVGFGLS